MAAQVQVKFFTKQNRFSVSDAPFNVPADIGVDDLSSLINSLLVESHGKGRWKEVKFDFLVGNEFLRLPLDKHLESKDISTESVIDVEYVEKHQAPSPEDSLCHDDWVSTVQACKKWILTGCYDNTIHIWSMDGERKLTIPGHLGPVKAVKWLRVDDDGIVLSFVSASHDQNVILWEWNSESNSVECIYVCRGHERSVDCVAVNDTGTKMVTGSWDRLLKIWSTEPSESDEMEEQSESRKKLKTESGRTSKNKTPLVTLSGHSEVVAAVQWIDKSEICSASWDHTIRIWDVEFGAIKDQFVGNKNFLDVDYSSQNRLLVSGSSDPFVRLWDPRTKGGSAVKTAYTSHTGWVTCVRWLPGSEHHFISGAHDWILKQWDTRSPRAPLYDMSGHKGNILCCDWTNKEFILSGGADNQLRIYKASDPV